MSKEKRPISWSNVWTEARELVWARRGRLALGLALLIVGRLAGLVVPASTKLIVDDVIANGRGELLPWIALAGGTATLIQAGAGFALAVTLGVAAQRSINDLRMRVQQHVGRLPVSYFESHKSGELISRIMNDAEGIRNLVGTGFVLLIGGIITSTLALGVLLWLNWRLTLLTVVALAIFGVVMVVGFSRLRPLFRKRGELTATLTGRLNESLGGARVVKAYTAEKREERIFAHGAHQLLRNIVQSMVGVSAVSAVATLLFGLVTVTLMVAGAREVLNDRMTVGDVMTFGVFTAMMVAPLIQMSSIGTQITEAFAGLDRIREVLSEPTEDEADAGREALPSIRGDVAFDGSRYGTRHRWR